MEPIVIFDYASNELSPFLRTILIASCAIIPLGARLLLMQRKQWVRAAVYDALRPIGISFLVISAPVAFFDNQIIENTNEIYRKCDTGGCLITDGSISKINIPRAITGSSSRAAWYHGTFTVHDRLFFVPTTVFAPGLRHADIAEGDTVRVISIDEVVVRIERIAPRQLSATEIQAQ